MKTTLKTQKIKGMTQVTRSISKALLMLVLMLPVFLTAQVFNNLEGNLSAQVTGETVHLSQSLAERNCGSNYNMNVFLVGDTLYWYQVDHGSSAFCTCKFDLSVTVDSMPSGHYTAKVFYTECPDCPSPGPDTVYVGSIEFDIVTPNSNSSVSIINQYQSDCHQNTSMQINLPVYRKGQYENDTILEHYGPLSSTGFAFIDIDSVLITNFVTGLNFKVVIDSISPGGAASVNVGDTLPIPVSFQLYTGNIGFHVIIEGTPEIANESYLCDLALNFTTGLDYGVYISPESEDSCFVEFLEGIRKFSEPETVNIFPNPANELVTINISSQIVGSGFVLVDKIGKQALSGTLTLESNEIDISHLDPGVYFFIINDNQSIITKKIVVQ